MLVRIPRDPHRPPPKEALEGVRRAIEQANRNAREGVEEGAEQAVASSQVLVNAVSVRCGTDMCLSKGLNPEFQCAGRPAGDGCDGPCAPPKPTWTEFRGTLVRTKKGEPRDDGGVAVNNGETVVAQAEYEAAGFDWERYLSPSRCADKCTFRATDGGRRTEAECGDGCLWASVTRQGVEKKECITDFTKTGRRACFGGCAAKGASPPDCVAFSPRPKGGACPAGSRPVKPEEAAACKAYAKATQTTAGMAAALVSAYDGGTTTAPTLSDAAAEAFCAGACAPEEPPGEATTVVPVYEADGATVRPCPVLNGAQSFPFPTGEEVSPQVCGKVGLVPAKNLLLAGKGDEDGVCRVESVDQENQGRAVRRALDHTLRETDLRTVRKEISRVAQAVAQGGFSFAQYGRVQNLSRRLVQAARTIRSKAAQTCGGDQTLRNLAVKTCRNVGLNGRAMPCVLNRASQQNVARQAGACLQQVMAKTTAMEEAVSAVAQASSLDLDGAAQVSEGRAINVGILAVLGTVAVATIVAVVRRAGRWPLYVGAGLVAVGAGYFGLGLYLGGRAAPKTADYKTYVGVKAPPAEGKLKTVPGTIKDVKDACDLDEACRGWVFESTARPTVCAAPTCQADECDEGGRACDACCPDGCVSMVDRAGAGAPAAEADCAGKPEAACGKPCLWAGGKCLDAPTAWGEASREAPERLWCMACTEKAGTGTLYRAMPERLETVDEVPPSQLACLASVPYTAGVKVAPPSAVGKADAARFRAIGVAGLAAGAAGIVAGALLAKGQ